jgi:hypothetical protein
MTINIQSPAFLAWTQLNAPSVDAPYWHEVEDGTQHDVTSILSGLDADQARPIEEMYAAAIARMVQGAFDARRAGAGATARRLSVASGRLCNSVVGLASVRFAA